MNTGNREVSLFFCEEGCDVATRDDRQDDLFRAPLERIIAIDRSLVRLEYRAFCRHLRARPWSSVSADPAVGRAADLVPA